MDKDVIVTIKGLERGLDGSLDGEIETCQPGVYKFMQGKHIITYDEPCEESPGVFIQNMLKISRGSVSIIKRGQTATRMVFKEGYHHSGQFIIDYGAYSLPIIIVTSHLVITESTDNINIQTDYSLKFHNGYISSRTVCINIRSAGVLQG